LSNQWIYATQMILTHESYIRFYFTLVVVSSKATAN